MSIPLLVTMDLEIAFDHNFEEQKIALQRLRVDLARLGLPITIFTTSNAAKAFTNPLSELARDGHEIGCHGLTHALSENYRLLSFDKAHEFIGQATSELKSTLGIMPTSFRGPYMSTSASTQRVLIDQGYVYDFSVCSQRMDLLTARGGTLGWLRAPRSPYHPAIGSPYKIGELPLWVVPLRSFGIPFISALLYLGGLSKARWFFDALLIESQVSSAPIVYLFHSYEFARKCEESPSAAPIYHSLYLQDREERYRRNLAFLEYMLRSGPVRAITANDLRL